MTQPAPSFHDVPITAIYARYLEGTTVPVAFVMETAEGAVLVTPFTGSQVYRDRLGGEKLLPPSVPIQPKAPEIATTEVVGTELTIEGQGAALSAVTVIVGTQPPVTVPTDKWGRWHVSASVDPASDVDVVAMQVHGDVVSDLSKPVRVPGKPAPVEPTPVEPVEDTPVEPVDATPVEPASPGGV